MTRFIICLFLLWPLAAHSAPLSQDFANATGIAKGVTIQCAGTETVVDGSTTVMLTDCVIRYAVSNGSLVLNFCHRFSSSNLLRQALNRKVSLYDVAWATPSTNWYWFETIQPLPPDIDVRCTQ